MKTVQDMMDAGYEPSTPLLQMMGRRAKQSRDDEAAAFVQKLEDKTDA